MAGSWLQRSFRDAQMFRTHIAAQYEAVWLSTGRVYIDPDGEKLSDGLIRARLIDFKEANDVFGHTVGDELLRAVSRRLEIAADGLHSAVRAQMHPTQPPIQWGGAIMWRGTTWAKPIRTGASFVGLGTHRHRVVFYPISAADPATGLADINWIAEITVDNKGGLPEGDWNKRVRHEDFIPHFEGWNYDWIDIPGMLRGAAEVFEYPMIDRDPVPTWVEGNAALLGDAAHAMYPTGSNGASQAIMDARYLGAALLEHGVNAQALQAYDKLLCPEISPLILRNRGAGPFGLLNLLDERCGGVFDDIETVIPKAERDEFMERYKAAAGFAASKLNAAPSIIPASATLCRKQA